jgi:two-component system LytT family sensor kinase
VNKMTGLAISKWWRYGIVAAIFAAVAVTEATQMRVMDMAVGAKIPFRVLLRMPLAYYGFWALSTPFIVWLARRFPIAPSRWTSSLAIHVSAWLGLSLLHACIRAPLHHFIYPWMKYGAGITSLIGYYFVGNITNNALIYAVVALIAYTVAYVRALQDRELKASQLEAHLGDARLRALKMQIQPHFLFNTFNSISALMHKDVEAAENMMTDLSDLLRRTLETSEAHEVTVREELELLEPYLSIQRTRFQDRLTVHVNVDSESYAAMMPNLTLHTLVENALHHGVARRNSGGEVWIEVRQENGMLVIRVSDNGPGLPEQVVDPFDRGIGLPNTKARLEQLYGNEQRFTITNRGEGGVVATIAVPYHSVALYPSSSPEAELV